VEVEMKIHELMMDVTANIPVVVLKTQGSIGKFSAADMGWH
jgi:hypothetical protein